MSARLSPLILCCLLFGACAPTSPVVEQNPQANLSPIQTDIRPGSKGQRLELLEGELLIPAGTSAYAIQSASLSSRLATAFELLIAPAYADDSTEADDLIETEQLKQLTARVNGEVIRFELLTSQEQSNGDLLVTFRLRDVPASDENIVFEFASPSGALKLKGVLPKLPIGTRKLVERFDIESTALAEAIEQVNENERDLSEDELKRLAKSAVVQDIRDKVYEHLLNSPKGKRFDEVLPAQARNLVQNSPLKTYVEQRKQCKQRACPRQPELPPRAARPVAQAVLQVAENRQAIRLNLISQTRSPTAEERTMLLRLGPLARSRACRERKIYPCPGLN